MSIDNTNAKDATANDASAVKSGSRPKTTSKPVKSGAKPMTGDKKPPSQMQALQKTPKGDNSPFYKKPVAIILLAATALIIVMALILVFIGGGAEEPRAAAVGQLNAEQMAAQSAEEKEDLQNTPPPVDPALASLPPNDFVFSDNPVQRLTEQSTENIFMDMPEYVNDGQKIIAVDQRFLYLNNPYLVQAQQELYNMTLAYIEQDQLLQKRFQDGTEKWFIRTGEGFEDTDFVLIDTASAAANLRQNMRAWAVGQMREKMFAAPWQENTPEQVVVAPAVDPALSAEERDRLLSMIDTQRSNNLDLVRQNKELREERQEIHKNVTDLFQRIEDSPKANAKLRATMLPKESGWQVSAVVGDLIYLNNDAGLMKTLRQGDKIPNSNLQIAHADENTKIVLVTPAN